MFHSRLGCCGNLRRCVLIVLYFNVVFNVIGALSSSGNAANLYGLPLHVFILSILFDVINIVISIIPIVKTPEKSSPWLMWFVYVKVGEIIFIIYKLFQTIRVAYLKNVWDTVVVNELSDELVDENGEEPSPDELQSVFFVVEYMFYGTIVISIGICLYFLIVVYSYLNEMKCQKNSLIAYPAFEAEKSASKSVSTIPV